MSDMGWVQIIKRAAMEAFLASKPCDYSIGTVIKTKPLTVKVSDSISLDEDFLLLARNVTDYEVEMEADHVTETAGQHQHGYKGKKKFKVCNHLEQGEQVLLFRSQGGSRYIITDRVVG